MEPVLARHQVLRLHSSIRSCDSSIPSVCQPLAQALQQWPVWVAIDDRHSRFISSLNTFVRTHNISYAKQQGAVVTTDIKRSGNYSPPGGYIVFISSESLNASDRDASVGNCVIQCFTDAMSSGERWGFAFDDMYRIAVCALLGLCGFHPPASWDSLPSSLNAIAHAIPVRSDLAHRLQLGLIPDQMSWGAYARIHSGANLRSERDPIALTLTLFAWFQHTLQKKCVTSTLHRQLWHQLVAQIQRKGLKFPVPDFHSAHITLRETLECSDPMAHIEKQFTPAAQSFVVQAKRMLTQEEWPEESSPAFNADIAQFQAFMRVARCIPLERGPIVSESQLHMLQYQRLDAFLTHLHRYAGGALYNVHCAHLKRLQAVSIVHPQFHGCVVSCIVNVARRCLISNISKLLHNSLANEFILTETFERRKNVVRTLVQAPRDSMRLLCLLSAVQLSHSSAVRTSNFHSLPLAPNLALTLTQVADIASTSCVWKQISGWITDSPTILNQPWAEWEAVAHSILRVWVILSMQSSNTPAAADLLRKFIRMRILNGRSLVLTHPPTNVLAIISKYNPILHKELQATCTHTKAKLVGMGETAKKCTALTDNQGKALIHDVFQLAHLTLPEFTVIMQGLQCTATLITAQPLGPDAELMTPLCLRADSVHHTVLDMDDERSILLRKTLQNTTHRKIADLKPTLMHAARIMCITIQLLEIGVGRTGYAWPDNLPLHDTSIFRLNSGHIIPFMESVVLTSELQVAPIVTDELQDVLSGPLITPAHIMQHELDLRPKLMLDQMPLGGWNKLAAEAGENKETIKRSLKSPNSVKRMLTPSTGNNLQAHTRGSVSTFDFAKNKRSKPAASTQEHATAHKVAQVPKQQKASSVFLQSDTGADAVYGIFDKVVDSRISVISLLEKFTRSD